LYTKSVLRKAMEEIKEKRKAQDSRNMEDKLNALQKKFNK